MDTKYGFVSVLRIRDTPTGEPAPVDPPEDAEPELDELHAASAAVTHTASPAATAGVRRLRWRGAMAALFVELSMVVKPLCGTDGRGSTLKPEQAACELVGTTLSRRDILSYARMRQATGGELCATSR
jgi:hypothetical protein